MATKSDGVVTSQQDFKEVDPILAATSQQLYRGSFPPGAADSHVVLFPKS